MHCGRTTAYASITHFRGILEWGMRSATKFKWTISARETLIKLCFSTANGATVSADEAEDTGDDEWL